MCKSNGQCENCQNTFETQISEVQNWAKKLKFDVFDPMQIVKQLGKLSEESVETTESVCIYLENQTEEKALNAKKEIGDVMVVVVILCQKLGFDLLDCLKKAHDKNNDPERRPILYNDQIVKRKTLIEIVGEEEADRLIADFYEN